MLQVPWHMDLLYHFIKEQKKATFHRPDKSPMSKSKDELPFLAIAIVNRHQALVTQDIQVGPFPYPCSRLCSGNTHSIFPWPMSHEDELIRLMDSSRRLKFLKRHGSSALDIILVKPIALRIANREVCFLSTLRVIIPRDRLEVLCKRHDLPTIKKEDCWNENLDYPMIGQDVLYSCIMIQCGQDGAILCDSNLLMANTTQMVQYVQQQAQDKSKWEASVNIQHTETDDVDFPEDLNQ
jgi:hypothetical protein